MSLAAEVLTKYFEAQKALVAIQSIDDRNVILSLPLHVSAYSRIELSITQISKSVFVVSDMGQTLGEMTDAGYQISNDTRKRILELVEMAKIQLDGKTLFRQCSVEELGDVIHEFADAAKTVGDVYLAFPSSGGGISKIEDDLKRQIRTTLDKQRYFYKETHAINGEVEEHTLDFVINPNKGKGLALNILMNADRLHAEAWAFKTQDIKRATKDQYVVAIVYNVARTVEISKHILDRMADVSIPSNAFEMFGRRLDSLNISRGDH